MQLRLVCVLLSLAGSGAALVGPASADGRLSGEMQVPKEAEKTLSGLANAFRKADAAGTTAFVAPGKDERIVLHLTGLTSGSYTREQATEALANTYFAERKILSLTPAECCTTGDDWTLVRTYRMRVRVGETERDGTLTVEIVRRSVGRDEFAWYLKSLKDA